MRASDCTQTAYVVAYTQTQTQAVLHSTTTASSGASSACKDVQQHCYAGHQTCMSNKIKQQVMYVYV